MKYDKFVKLKKLNREVIVPAFDRAGLNKIATSISQCGDFSVMYECTHCGTREWKGFTRCKNKFCACCNAVKSLIWIAKAYSKLEQYLKEGKYIVMLTLTIRDRPNLTEALNILNKAWKYFHDKDRKCANEFNHTFAGGIKSLEVKTGKNSGEWHPHLHCILVKDQFSYDKPYLDSAWARCVKRAGGEIDEKINDIRSIYMRDENGVKRYDKDALLVGIVESVKYISKFDYNKETTDRLKELVNSLHGVHQIDTFGCCKNIHKDVEDELSEEVQLGDIVEHVCQVCGCNEAKLVEMLTDRIPTADGIVLTDKVKISKPFTGKMLEGGKASNGKISWDSLQEPKKTDNEILEDMFYQATMFDEQGSNLLDRIDKLCEQSKKKQS